MMYVYERGNTQTHRENEREIGGGEFYRLHLEAVSMLIIPFDCVFLYHCVMFLYQLCQGVLLVNIYTAENLPKKDAFGSWYELYS